MALKHAAVTWIFVLLAVGFVLAENDTPLNNALTEEDECSANGDCSMNALQRSAAIKMETADSSEHVASEGEVQSREVSQEELDREVEMERKWLEEFPDGASMLEYFNESTWTAFLEAGIPENEGAGPKALVDELNGLYNNPHTGVFQRLVYSRNMQPWHTSSPTMSWAVMNKYSWDEYSHGITVFNFHGAASGIIAKPSAMKIPGVLKCTYPCDGYSDHRYYDNRGCACGQTYYGTKGLGSEACPASGTDWCDQYGPNFKFRGNGIPCSYKPSETGRMLSEYHKVKTGRASQAMQASCTASWLGVTGNGNSAWNEAVVDTATWESTGGASHIAAFVLPSTCLNSWYCKQQFWNWYNRFKMAGKGKRPVLVMDLSKRTSPYSLLQG